MNLAIRFVSCLCLGDPASEFSLPRLHSNWVLCWLRPATLPQIKGEAHLVQAALLSVPAANPGRPAVHPPDRWMPLSSSWMPPTVSGLRRARRSWTRC